MRIEGDGESDSFLYSYVVGDGGGEDDDDDGGRGLLKEDRLEDEDDI